MVDEWQDFKEAYAEEPPSFWREKMAKGIWRQPTTGLAPGYAQMNLVIVPEDYADDFEQFCELNSQACPLLVRLSAGIPIPHEVAPYADLRTDLPGYRLFWKGIPQPQMITDLRSLWQQDWVSFLLGCSFTFERALAAEGLKIRHWEEGRNVPMFITNRECEPAGPFKGPMVVSMRPFTKEELEKVKETTGKYIKVHGPPVHIGDPAELGVKDLQNPDFGDAVTLREGDVPCFWACGVTSQVALENAKLSVAVSHFPGCMFITDVPEEKMIDGASREPRE
ncbi:Putative hydro-lyase [Planctomycetales bacterium 10988]|nr:Putative hydro-lyase [Planctomycetales bacterium 10988]